MGEHNNFTGKALISFIQNGVVAVEIIFKFSMLDSGFLAAKETDMAEQCIQSQFINVLVNYPLVERNVIF